MIVPKFAFDVFPSDTTPKILEKRSYDKGAYLGERCSNRGSYRHRLVP